MKKIQFSESFQVEDRDADADEKTKYCTVEWSASNHSKLAELIQEKMAQKSNLNVLEIGVDRNAGDSSTKCFKSNLRHEDKYLGVDIADRRHIVEGNRINFIQTDAKDYQKVLEKLTSLNMLPIDILFIDGWHSLNQVLAELEYVQHMNDDGIVILHDTNGHPGPREVIRCIDKKEWDVRNHCPQENDYGLSSIRAKI
jgi:cephalosporin hydroxylase